MVADEDNEARDALEHISEVAAQSLGWVVTLVQNAEGNIIGAYIGTEDWVNKKIGIAEITH